MLTIRNSFFKVIVNSGTKILDALTQIVTEFKYSSYTFLNTSVFNDPLEKYTM